MLILKEIEYNAKIDYLVCKNLAKGLELGIINPFKYKGYYYDEESEMYYCISRYYVPEWCRWLNADNPKHLELNEINGINLFSYCYNNPIMLYDYFGTWSWKTFWKCFAATAIVVACVALAAYTGGTSMVVAVAVATTVSVAAQGVSDAIHGEFSGVEAYFGAAAGGAIAGLGTGLGTTMLTAGIGSVASGIIDDSIKSVGDGFIQFALGSVTGAVSYGIGKGISKLAASNKLSSNIGKSYKNSVIKKISLKQVILI